MNESSTADEGSTEHAATGSSFEVEANGERHTLTAGTTVSGFLDILALSARRLAVELNGELLPKDQHDRALRAGDRLEIVTFVGGG